MSLSPTGALRHSGNLFAMATPIRALVEWTFASAARISGR